MISSGPRAIGAPWASVTVAPSAVTVTISPFSIVSASRVSARNAGMADATNVSSSPIPTISGHSWRAATSVSAWAACIAANA